MTIFRNLNGQGATVNLTDPNRALTTTADQTISESGFIRVGVAGNLVLQNGGVDRTINAAAGEYVPLEPGTVLRSTTVASGLHFFKD